MNDVNPSLRLGEDSVNAVLATLQSIRERALSKWEFSTMNCTDIHTRPDPAGRSCLIAMHTELSHILELQHNFRRLSYFDLMGRSRLTIQLTRVTIRLPIALEKAIRDQGVIYGHQRNITSDDKVPRLPRHVISLIMGIDVMLERMERILK